mgnify:CR=1 FL=1
MPKHLRLITQNLWHGLDHTRPKVMFPIETREQNAQRTQALIDGLAEQMEPLKDPAKLCLVALQEVNPVGKLTRYLAKKLRCKKYRAEANVGLRIGNLSYPFYLQEGLAFLWSAQSLRKFEGERITLSDPIPEFRLVLGKWKLPISLQLAERRVALLIKGIFDGLKIGFVNLHLHHGAPVPGGHPRRLKELHTLFSNIETEFQSYDYFFLMGDFNFESSHDEVSLLKSKGFTEISLGEKDAPLITWDSGINPICHLTSSQDKHTDAANKWGDYPRQLDHIFMFDKRNPGKISENVTVSAYRLFDKARNGVFVSDHFGIGVDLIWK